MEEHKEGVFDQEHGGPEDGSNLQGPSEDVTDREPPGRAGFSGVPLQPNPDRFGTVEEESPQAESSSSEDWPEERLDESTVGEEEPPQEQLDRMLTPGPEMDPPARPKLAGRYKSPTKRRTVKPELTVSGQLTPEQRLLILDVWRRSGLTTGDFADLVGVSKHTLYNWKKKFDEEGPAGLLDKPKGGPRGSRLDDLTRRTILMLKEQHPEWGSERISNMLLRGPALPASPGAVLKVLKESGYEVEERPTKPHRDKPRRFERARANQMWQTDLFSFVLKRQNVRLYLVAFMDDHSRFITGFGLHASASTAMVLEVLGTAIANWGPPQEVLTDNGPQYVTWRGKSAFNKYVTKKGIKQIIGSPRRPQTLGKVERFWGTLWRELIQGAIFADLGDARIRIGHFIDWYNFHRTHSGIDGLVPADRFFNAAPQVQVTLKARVAANALDLARHGPPKKPFYMAGHVAGKNFAVHAEGERVILTDEQGQRQEVELVAPETKEQPSSPSDDPVCPTPEIPIEEDHPAVNDPPPPGSSPLDEGLKQLQNEQAKGGAQ